MPYQPHFSRCDINVSSAWNWFYFDLHTAFALSGFQPDFWNSLGQTSIGQYGILSHKKYPDLCSLINQIIQTANGTSIYRKQEVSLLIGQFLIQVSKIADSEHINPAVEKFSKVSYVLPAIEYIRQHYQEQLEIPHLAALCNMSPTSFRRHFHLALNMSPTEYILSIRMKVASHYLRSSNMNISHIAVACGIPDTTNFIRYFSKCFDMTPKKYREKHL